MRKATHAAPTHRPQSAATGRAHRERRGEDSDIGDTGLGLWQRAGWRLGCAKHAGRGAGPDGSAVRSFGALTASRGEGGTATVGHGQHGSSPPTGSAIATASSHTTRLYRTGEWTGCDQ